MSGEQLDLFDLFDALHRRDIAAATFTPDARTLLPVVYDDGGRAEAGYRGQARDCVCRAIAIAAKLSYEDVYQEINDIARTERPGKRRGDRRSSARTGVFNATVRRYIEKKLGWQWIPTMLIGSGCTVHLREGELPPRGRLIVSVSKHLVAVIDGTIHDTHDPSRAGTRCVYGYWAAP